MRFLPGKVLRKIAKCAYLNDTRADAYNKAVLYSGSSMENRKGTKGSP